MNWRSVGMCKREGVCGLGVALLGACQKESLCVFYSITVVLRACLCSFVNINVNKGRPMWRAKFKCSLRVCGYVKADESVWLQCQVMKGKWLIMHARTYVSSKQSNINLDGVARPTTKLSGFLDCNTPQCSRLPVTCLSLVFIVSLCSPEPCLPAYMSLLIFCVCSVLIWHPVMTLREFNFFFSLRSLLPVFG